MASPYSQPIQYKEREDQFNLPLLQQALSMRQEKYDYNRARVQQTIDNLAGLDLIRGVDQDYLYERLEKVVDTLNQDGSGDVSLDSQADYLSNYVSQVADDKIVNAYYGTQSVRNIESQAEAARESGEYSDDNYDYSMQDAMAWMANPEAGAAYRGRTDYVPYADMNEAMIKSIEAMEASKFSHIDNYGKYHFIKVDGEELSEERVKMAAELTIKSDPKLMAQAKVNAWSQFRGVDDNAIIGNYKEVMTSRYDYYDELTKEYNRKLATAETDAEKEEIQQYLEAFESEKQSINDVLNTSPDKISREAVENEMYLDQLLNQYAQTYAYRSITNRDIISNDAAIKLAERASSVMSEVIEYEAEGKYGAAARTYNNNASLLQSQGYASSYEFWSAEQSVDDGVVEPIMTSGVVTKERADELLLGATGAIEEAVDGAYNMLLQVYGEEKLQNWGYIDKNGEVNRQLVLTDLNAFTKGGGLLGATALENNLGILKSPLTEEQKIELYQYNEMYNQSIPVIDAIEKSKKISLVTNDAIDAFIKRAPNVKGDDGVFDWSFFGYGGEPAPVISVYEQDGDKAYKIYYDHATGSYVKEEGSYTFQAKPIEMSGGRMLPAVINTTRYLPAVIRTTGQLLKGTQSARGLGTLYAAKQYHSDREDLQDSGYTYQGDPQKRTYITEEEVREMVLASDANKARVEISSPSSKTGWENFKEDITFWDGQSGEESLIYISDMGVTGDTYQDERAILLTAGELSDMTTAISYYVTGDEPATITAASELAQIAKSNGENLSKGMASLVDPEFYEKLKSNSVTGAGEQVSKTKVNLPTGLKFYYNPATGNATLESDEGAFDIPIQQLNPNGEAYYMIMTQKQTADLKLSYNLKAKFKFNSMPKPILNNTEDEFPVKGEDIMPSLVGYKFNFIQENVFTKGKKNTIRPKIILDITTPDGQKERKAISSSQNKFSESEYADAMAWLNENSSKFFPNKFMTYEERQQVTDQWINMLLGLGVISEKEYQQYYSDSYNNELDFAYVTQ